MQFQPKLTCRCTQNSHSTQMHDNFLLYERAFASLSFVWTQEYVKSEYWYLSSDLESRVNEREIEKWDTVISISFSFCWRHLVFPSLEESGPRLERIQRDRFGMKCGLKTSSGCEVISRQSIRKGVEKKKRRREEAPAANSEKEKTKSSFFEEK